MESVRKYMKRIVSGIFAALIGCFCLASCAENKPAESYPDTQETPVASAAAGTSKAEIQAWSGPTTRTAWTGMETGIGGNLTTSMRVLF